MEHLQNDLVKVNVQPCLREAMADAHISQKELSGRTGISASSLSRFDSQSSHKDDHLFLIAEALSIPVTALFKIQKE
ncbi:helix-turn-helix domain-containing protein [Sporolactobacillus sp. KGMB 08714]|uniref:helix-turn-helix domain-containing protein n=1 Tax=Sporolactobacillus sp. KGMB 08714 TaxID=3064704 RepID=UPI002FBDE3D6